MLADYYDVTKLDGKPYTKQGLVRVCNTDKENGTQYKDMNRVLKSMGLMRRRCKNLLEVAEAIEKGQPVLTLIPDPEEPGTYHYIIISGFMETLFSLPKFYVTDPYYGEGEYDWLELEQQIKKAGNWVWAINEKV